MDITGNSIVDVAVVLHIGVDEESHEDRLKELYNRRMECRWTGNAGWYKLRTNEKSRTRPTKLGVLTLRHIRTHRK